MIARLLLVATLALLMGCDGLPGSFKRAAADVDATAPTEATAETAGEAEEATPEADAPDSKGEAEANPAPEPTSKPEPKADRNAAARAKCLAGGDLFSKTKTGAFVCVSRTRDSGKTCTGSGQCEGSCLARSGTCSPVTPLVGCHDIVTDNGGMSTVCID